MGAVRKFIGGRYIRRPCFDFEWKRTDDRRFTKVLANFLTRRFAVQSLTNLGNGIGVLQIKSDIETRSRSIKLLTMALNKLSIDKVDLTNKRVLIRYIFLNSILLNFNSIYNYRVKRNNTS